MSKIRILTVSNTSWSDENSFGLSYNSLFDGLEEYFEFANVYCNYGVPKNSCVSQYCQITEKTIIENIKNKKQKKCRIFNQADADENSSVLSPDESNTQNNIKKRRLQLSMWARDIVWKKGLRDMSEIVGFVKVFSPDIIFTPMYYMFHTNKILQTIIASVSVPVISYISDDIYRTTKFPCSPLYAIDRFFKRKTIKKSILMCNMLYVACEEQALEYEKLFGKKCKVLRKPAENTVCFDDYSGDLNDRKIFLYAGNLGAGRADVVARTGKCVSSNGGVLRVYSATPITQKTKKLFQKCGIDYRGHVSYEVAEDECRKADVLLYVEGFGKKSVALTKYSVSTKFSGYLCSGKLILAVGHQNIHTIKYLTDEKAAVVAAKESDICCAVKACMNPNKMIIQNAQSCAKRDFDKVHIQKMLIEDIYYLAGKWGDSL